MRHCPTAITDNKEVVMVNPVTNEDVDEDTEDPENGEMEVTDHNVWVSRLRPRSLRTATS